MCGLAGILSFNPEPTNEALEFYLKSSAERLKHRGPDFQATHLHIDPQNRFRMGFAHALLSIIGNPLDGRQPFIKNDCILVFNGTLYNHHELRKELQHQGILFRTQTDTEVLIEGLSLLGPDFLKKCRGMFAFAFFNPHRDLFFLGRDPVGVKPLYFFEDPDKKVFAFSSEYKTLLPFIRNATLDSESLQSYLKFRYVPEGRTLIKNLYKIDPGTVRIFSLQTGSYTDQKYWGLSQKEHAPDEDEVFAALRTAAQRRAVSDVSFGALLSGGIDSSLVCDLLSKGGSFQTYTLKMKDPALDESRAAAEISKSLGLKNTTIEPIDPTLDDLKRVTYHLDDPYGDPIILSLDHIFRSIKGSNRVIVTGEGADELFSGYVHHRASYLVSACPDSLKKFGNGILSVLPDFIIRALVPYSGRLEASDLALAKSRLTSFLRAPNLGNFRNVFSLFENSDLDSNVASPASSNLDLTPLYSQLRKWDMNNWLCDSQLHKLDKLAMAHSIEAREPFVDIDLISTVFSMNDKKHFSTFCDKPVLRSALTGRTGLPSNLIAGRKKSFYQPLKTQNDVFLNELKGLIFKNVNSFDGILKKNVLNTLLDESSPSLSGPKKIYSLASFVLWRENILKGAGSERFPIN